MESVIMFYVIVALIVVLDYEYCFYKGHIKTLLKEDAKMMENFITINWESNWWHLYFLILGVFWLPSLIFSPLMMDYNQNNEEEK